MPNTHCPRHNTNRKMRQLSLWLIHLSFVVIVCGGIITHFYEEQGHIHLREGETTHEFQKSSGDSIYTPTTLPFYIKLETFSIEQEGNNHIDYVSHIVVRDRHHTDTTSISMNKPLFAKGYRIIQASYDPDMNGTHLAIIYDPWGTGLAIFGFFLFLLSSSYLLYDKGRTLYKHNSIATVQQFSIKKGIVALCVSIIAIAPLAPLFATPLQPILRTPLLYIHVSTIIFSYILLVLSMLWRRVLPIAVLLLSIGIVLGAFWGSISWGTYWSWDPKETWALITLVLYALPLHMHMMPVLRRPLVHKIYSFICLFALIITYIGVNFLMQSKHSYLGM